MRHSGSKFTDPHDLMMLQHAIDRKPVTIRRPQDDSPFTVVLLAWYGARCRVKFPNGNGADIDAASVVFPARAASEGIAAVVERAVSAEMRAQARRVEVLLLEAILAAPANTANLMVVYQDGCAPGVASCWPPPVDWP